GVPDPDVVPHPPCQKAPAVGAEADLAVVDPVVGALGLVGLPATHFAPAGVENDQLPTATEHGKAAVGMAAQAPRPGRQRPPPSTLPALIVPDPNLLPFLRLGVARVQRGDRPSVGGEGRIDDPSPRAEGRPGRLASRNTEGPRASEIRIEARPGRDGE